MKKVKDVFSQTGPACFLMLLLFISFTSCDEDGETCLSSRAESATWLNNGSNIEYRNTSPFHKVAPVFKINGTSTTTLSLYNICPTRDVIVYGEIKGFDANFSPPAQSVRLVLSSDVLINIPIRTYVPLVQEGATWSVTHNVGTLSNNFDGPGNLDVSLEIVAPFSNPEPYETTRDWFIAEFKSATIRAEWVDY